MALFQTDIERNTELGRRPRVSTLALAGIIGPIWLTTFVVLALRLRTVAE